MSTLRPAWLAALPWLCLTACLTTQEVSLGADRPLPEDEPDAEGATELQPTDSGLDPADAAVVTDAAPARRPTAVSDAGRFATRDAGDAALPETGVPACTLNGHRPFEGLPPPTSLPVSPSLPRPEDRDGGLSSILDSEPLKPPTGLPPGYEAGVPPFCCTLTTPWYCAKP